MILAVPALIAIPLVLLRDAGTHSLITALFVAGALCLVALASVGFELLAQASAKFLPTRWARIASLVLFTGPPLGLGLYRTALGGETLTWLVPLTLLAGALISTGALLVCLLHSSLQRRTLAASYSLGTSGFFLFTHLETETLSAVRPGTELLHLGLFVGTWLVSLAPVATAALRVGDPALRGFWQGALSVAALGLGFGALECDRALFVGLYPAIHAWLAVIGFSLLLLGLTILLQLLGGMPALGTLRVRLTPLAARPYPLFALALAAVVFTLLAPASASVTVRARLAQSALGATVLEALPAWSPAPRDVAQASELDYPRYLQLPPPRNAFNILLITVDALRADALKDMPEVQQLAEEGVLFERAYAQGSRTAIGTGALMTGRYSANLDWELWLYQAGTIYNPKTLSPEKLESFKGKYVYTTLVSPVPRGMLAERLQDSGFSTSAVPFAEKNEFFRRDLTFARGFDSFVDLTDQTWKPPSTKRVIARSLKELKKNRDKRWFHWVHLYDPHEAGRNRQKYNRMVRHVSKGIGSLVKWLKRSRVWDSTVVVLLADHGEAYGEHRHFSHGTSLYEEQVRIPFVMRIPGISAGRVTEPVASIDATATLAVLAGANTEHLDGVNLLPRLRGDVKALSHPVFTELHRFISSKGTRTSDLKAIIDGHWKLIWDRKRSSAELFNLQDDPKELKSLVNDEPQQFERLQRILESFVARGEKAHPLPG